MKNPVRAIYMFVGTRPTAKPPGAMPGKWFSCSNPINLGTGKKPQLDYFSCSVEDQRKAGVTIISAVLILVQHYFFKCDVILFVCRDFYYGSLKFSNVLKFAAR